MSRESYKRMIVMGTLNISFYSIFGLLSFDYTEAILSINLEDARTIVFFMFLIIAAKESMTIATFLGTLEERDDAYNMARAKVSRRTW